ncbi:MAG: hypothetical protein HGGPFJEG_01637 [Ignavibacteria bacterium]|nr:hypothetical protein [Ignavibacteria bacterium]
MLTKLKNLFTKEDSADSGNDKSALEQKFDNHNPELLKKSDNNNLNTDIPDSAESREVTDEPSSVALNDKQVNVEEVKEEVIKVLKTCYDPEIPVDVWELGLIYDIVVAVNGDVMIIMTLTSPACPVAGILPAEIEQKVKSHPKVTDCKVQLTFDPPWNQNMMSEVAKLELGFL